MHFYIVQPMIIVFEIFYILKDLYNRLIIIINKKTKHLIRTFFYEIK